MNGALNRPETSGVQMGAEGLVARALGLVRASDVSRLHSCEATCKYRRPSMQGLRIFHVAFL